VWQQASGKVVASTKCSSSNFTDVRVRPFCSAGLRYVTMDNCLIARQSWPQLLEHRLVRKRESHTSQTCMYYRLTESPSHFTALAHIYL